MIDKLSKLAIGQALALNNRVSKTAANGFDWVFRRDTLIKSGRTWFELVHDGDPMSVRYYGLPDEKGIELADGSHMPIKRKQYPIPLVLVPPLGVTTETFDLMPQRSLVRYMAAAGFKTYLIDWGTPTKKHAKLDLRSYSLDMMEVALEKIRKHSGSEDLSMMGWCLGGLLSLMYQGQAQDPRIRNIVTVASPIDLSSGGAIAAVAQTLNAPAKLIRNYTSLRLHTLDPARIQMPAWATTLAFKLTDPLSSVTTYWDLITGIADREYVESYSTTSDYLNNMLIYPGGVIQDMTVKVIVDNQIASGKIQLRDSLVEIDKIKSSLLAFAGKTDALVPESVAKQIIDIVGSKDKAFKLAPGGHMGVILGSKAQKFVWAESAAWLAKRSQA
jgi:polyhydroxyalkanoate synthase